ncbi:hypothetical protein IMSAGC011_03083 [Lachnospiraceae bacterium]|nr:hypothetical protein IMSAGC011_03083 [Lachnospiraceae bacterium]
MHTDAERKYAVKTVYTDAEESVNADEYPSKKLL